MKHFLKYFCLMFMIITSSAAFTSCSDHDDEPEITTGNILGTWISTSTETMSNGVSITTTRTLYFKSDGTGYRSTSDKYSTGAEESYTYTFRYTVATATDGVMTVTMIDDDDNYTQSVTCSQTGNTLLFGSRTYTRQ